MEPGDHGDRSSDITTEYQTNPSNVEHPRENICSPCSTLACTSYVLLHNPATLPNISYPLILYHLLCSIHATSELGHGLCFIILVFPQTLFFSRPCLSTFYIKREFSHKLWNTCLTKQTDSAPPAANITTPHSPDMYAYMFQFSF